MRALLLVLAAGVAWGAAPPAAFTPEQAGLLRGRPWLGVSEKTLEIELSVYGPWHRQAERSARLLGDQYWTRGEWPKAAECRRVVLEARRRLDGEGHWKTVDARLDLEEAVARQKSTPTQRDALRRADALFARARASVGEGRAAEALPLIRDALGIFKGVLGGRHRLYAASLSNLAFLHQAMGDHEKALPLFLEALPITGETQGQRHPNYALSLSNLAMLHQAMGDHGAALPLYRRALALYKEVLGARHPDYAICLHGLASLYLDMGRHAAALPLTEHALAITRETQGEGHRDYAGGLHNLAHIHQAMGDHKAALPLFRRALALRKALGEGHPDYAQSLASLAGLHQETGDDGAALPLLEEAMALTKAAVGEGHRLYADRLNGLAGLHAAAGRHEKALGLSVKSLAVTKRALGVRHPAYATGLHNLAVLHFVMGDHEKALPLLEQALALSKERLGELHPRHAQLLNTLAILQQTRGEQKAALALSSKALAIAEGNLRVASSGQSDRQQLAAAESLRGFLDTRLSLMDVEAHAPALAWKGAVLLRQRQRRLFSALSADPATRKAAEDLRQATRQIAALSASELPARERLEGLTREQERLQAGLAARSADARAAFGPPGVTPETLAAALPEGAALVDYHFYVRHLAKGGRQTIERQLVAFVSRKGRPTARVDLGPATAVEEAAWAWRPLLVGGKPAGAPARTLKRLIWSPLERHLAGAKAVLVSPDRVLATVPFAALPGSKAGTYLIEDVALAVVPAPSLLPGMSARPAGRGRPRASLLTVGDVDYDGATAGAADDDRRAPPGARHAWGGLPGTAGEAAAVRASFASLFKGGPVIGLSKAGATKKAVREALAKVRYAHIATHGFFAPRTVRPAAPPGEMPGLFGREGVTGWHPLLLSGLALAGANREPRGGDEDGILTALEISEMELPALELVVLSACETGLGKAAGGEGLLGLQRAFAAAGARSVVASLWCVDDRATQLLMSDFYENAWDAKEAVGLAEALRRAQLTMLNGKAEGGKVRGVGVTPEVLARMREGGRVPPYYWAAFVLSGDWR